MSAFRRAGPVAFALATLASISSQACAPKVVVSLPTGAMRADAAAEAVFAESRSRCQAIHSWSAELSAAGRVRGHTVRTRVLAGTTDRGDLRLEAVAPFGAPFFVLVAAAERASLLFPREGRVLRDAAAFQVLDAMIGLELSAADLHALLTGCGVSQPRPGNGRAIGREWRAVDVADSQTIFFRETAGTWRLEAARLGALTVGYAGFEGTTPREILLVADERNGGTGVRLRLQLSQVEENAALPHEAFEITVPPDARPLTVAELRERGLRSTKS
jgi:hypothetical protein